MFTGSKPIFVIDIPEAGRYAIESDATEKQPIWESCREQFASKMNESIEGFFFSHHPWQSFNVASFIAKSEEILELPQRSLYKTTEKDSIVWISPARFWMNCWIKRSFLTILLRCGMYYNPQRDDYEDALFGDKAYNDKAREYTQATRMAVMRFMFGFTKFVKPDDVIEPTSALQKTLWVEVFKNRSIKELKNILVAEKPMPSFGVLGTDAIWA